MSVETAVDWETVKDRLREYFKIPDWLPNSGVVSLMVKVYQRTDDRIVELLDLTHGQVGVVEGGTERLVSDAYDALQQGAIMGMSRSGYPGKALMKRETEARMVFIQYTHVDGAEDASMRWADGMILLLDYYCVNTP